MERTMERNKQKGAFDCGAGQPAAARLGSVSGCGDLLVQQKRRKRSVAGLVAQQRYIPENILSVPSSECTASAYPESLLVLIVTRGASQPANDDQEDC